MDLAASPRPRFRTDLVAECIEAEGQRFIDVIDPDTGDAFRFYEVEYSIACAMDGERDVHGLVQWAKEELGIEPSRAELESVITTLGSLGYLDAAAARGAMDVELGHAAPPPPLPKAPAAGDVELGLAGGRPTARMEDLGADDVELGLPGAPIEPMPSLRRSTQIEDDEGPTHLPAASPGDFEDEVSVDLSEHLSIRPSDVKEAVRMSRGMKAVEVPPELLDELGQKEAEAASRAAAAKAAAEAAHELEAEEPPPPTPAVRAPEPAPAPVATKPPVELPAQPVVVSKKRAPSAPPVAAQEEAPAHARPLPAEEPGSGGVSKLLVVLLVLVILGAAAFFVWKYVIDKPKGDDAGTGTSATSSKEDPTGQGPGTAAETPPPPPPPPAGPPTATLAAQGEPPVAVQGGQGGIVVFAAAEGAEVQAGDTLVQYRGVAPLLVKLGSDKSGLIWDIETRYPREIEAATKKRDAALAQNNKAAAKQAEARIKERSQRLAEQQKLADGLRAKISELQIEAPVAGKVVSPVKKGQKVAADQVVATIDAGQKLVATFEVREKAPAVDASVRIAAKDLPDQKANCMVSAVEGPKVSVTCEPDIEIAAGTTVVLELE